MDLKFKNKKVCKIQYTIHRYICMPNSTFVRIQNIEISHYSKNNKRKKENDNQDITVGDDRYQATTKVIGCSFRPFPQHN